MLSKNTFLALTIALSLSSVVATTGNLLPQYVLSDGSTTERLSPGESFSEAKPGFWWYKIPLMFFASGGSIVGLMLLPSAQRRYQAIMTNEQIDTQAMIEARSEVAKEEALAIAVEQAEQRAIAASVSNGNYTALPTQSQVESSAAAPTRDQPAETQVRHDQPQQVMNDDGVNLLFERIYSNKKKHLLIPAETGSGKTTLLLGVVDYYLRRDNNSKFFFSTAKPGPFLGFEDVKAEDGKKHVILLDMSHSYTVEALIERLEWVIKEMVRRQHERTKAEQTGKEYNPSPLIVVLDEWLATLSLADSHTKEMIREWQSVSAQERGDKPINYKDRLVDIINNIAIMGREDNVAVWIFGQDHQVQNAGINTGLQKNFGVVVPFRKGAEQAVEHALIGRSPVPTHAQGKEIYASALTKMNQEPNVYLAYSNIYGHEILNVPYLPGIKRKRLFSDGDTTSSPQPSTSPTKNPWDVVALRKEGADLADAICQVYGCEKGTIEFNRAKLAVMSAIS
ncbi:ATP-binding protein [Leptolyngbyaceae cyanobacterium CCMR0082]|uniref:ATP-binding protein n=1 Tax=Adonisia turfae CCMR0082 TaxID=2304604 RepID=A0A6M0SHG2_9CYAN|nr:DEAD/DEAH box helicase family protein [Adonisia turfae]NEZ67814.1 ATP-binding protein [Adonisia turfae CCMR0082]